MFSLPALFYFIFFSVLANWRFSSQSAWMFNIQYCATEVKYLFQYTEYTVLIHSNVSIPLIKLFTNKWNRDPVLARWRPWWQTKWQFERQHQFDKSSRWQWIVVFLVLSSGLFRLSSGFILWDDKVLFFCYKFIDNFVTLAITLKTFKNNHVYCKCTVFTTK
jgi:hypothetical protein